MTPTSLIKLDNIFLKREDQNQTGSAKDRAILVQVENLISQGYQKAVISSTGNAAISALHFCQKNNIELTIFVSQKISPNKLKFIQNQTKNIIFSLKPISDAIKFSKKENAYLLRQSTDPKALIGYQSIGEEILKQQPNVTSIFIAVGSGTTMLGISQSLPNAKLFAIQSAANCPLTKLFDPNYILEDKLITDSISVKSLPLKDKLVGTIKKSQGSGLVIQNQSILEAQKTLEQNNIETSSEGALALAGYYKAIENKLDPGLYPVIILTGAKR